MATEVLTPGIRTESPEWRGLDLITSFASIASVLLLITALLWVWFAALIRPSRLIHR